MLEDAGPDLGMLASKRAAQLDDVDERRLHVMNDAAVDTQVLPALGTIMQDLDRVESVIRSRELNEKLAHAVTNYLDRFRTRASLLEVPIYPHPAAPPPFVMKTYFSGRERAIAACLSTPGWGWHAECEMYALRMLVARVFEELSAMKVIAGPIGEGNALAESQFALFKTELIRKRRPWRTVEEVELATLEWVWWVNNQRLHSGLDYRTPAEVEAAYYAEQDPVLATATHGKQ
jgi:hypothetical protein